MKRLLFINQYYWPDEAATAQLLADLAQSLVRDGYGVTVVCGRSRYACAGNLPSGTFDHRGVRIERVSGSDRGRHSLAGRLMDMATFMVSAGRLLAGLPRHDLVVATTSPPWAGVLGMRYHAQNQVPFVLWLHDIYPDVAVRLGALRSHFLRRALHEQSVRTYRAAARIVAPAKSMAGTLAAHGVAENKLRVIPNWANLDEIRAAPVHSCRFRGEQGWSEDPVLMYAGNMGRAHEIDTMLALAALLQKKEPSMRLVVVGDSPRHTRFMEEAKRLNMTRITRLPAQPRSRLGELLGAADAHLVAQKVELEGLVVPSKFYGCVAAGRPVIFVGPRSSEIARQVLDAHLGTVIEPGGAEAEVSHAKKTLFMARHEEGAVSRLRQWAEEHASHRVRLAQFGELLKEVLV